MKNTLALLIVMLALVSPSGGQAWAQRAPFEVVPNVGHAGDISALAFSRDNRQFASAGDNGTVKLWELATGRLVRNMEARVVVKRLAFSPDGRLLASAGADGAIKLWNLETGRIERTISGSGEELDDVAFSPDGRQIASDDGTITLWDVASGRAGRGFPKIESTVMAFATDAPQLFTVFRSEDQLTFKFYDLETGKMLRIALPCRTIDPQNPYFPVAVSQDARRVAFRSDHEFTFWDSATGAQLGTLQHGMKSDYGKVALSYDGALVAADDGSTIRIWGTDSGRLVRTFEGLPHDFYPVAISKNAKLLVAGSFETPETRLRLWNLETGTPGEWLAGQAASAAAVAISADGNLIAADSKDKFVRFWDASGKLLHTSKQQSDVPRHLAFSPDGSLLVSRSTVWDVRTFRPLRITEMSADVISPDGRFGLSTAMVLWDIRTGRKIRNFGGGPLGPGPTEVVTFSPDGRRLAAGDNQGTIAIYDVASGKELRTLEYQGSGNHIGAGHLAFSPDGHRLLSSTALRGKSTADIGREHVIEIWDVESGRRLRTLVGHNDEIAALAFSPDGRGVISASIDRNIRVWDERTGALLASTIVAADGEWLTITSEGFFAASENGARMLNVVRGLTIYSIDQFYQSLYRPDLVREKLSGDPQGKVKAAAAALDLSKAMDSGPAPTVALSAPAAGSETSAEEVEVEAAVTDRGGGIGTIEWRVNGVTVGLETRGLTRQDRPAADGTAVKIRRTLSLDRGDNRIEVVAYNARKLIASGPAVLQVRRTGAAEPGLRPRLHVLVVGLNDYYDGALALSYAVPDAKAIGAAFTAAGRQLYESVEVTSVLDSEVTRAHLDKVFDQLGRKVRPQDVFVFFLAGHGKMVGEHYYFLPHEFRYQGERSIMDQGVGQALWQEWFARIAARKSILLYDTCESGSLTGELVAQRGLERLIAVEKLTQATGRTVLTATTDRGPALEGYHGHGVFTYALLDAIGAGDENNDGLVDVTELARFVDRAVPKLSEKLGRRQVPQMKIVGSDFPLVSRAQVLADRGEAAVPSRATHVVIQPTSVRPAIDAAGVLIKLDPGTQVSLVESAGGWALVAKDGRRLGYVPEDALAKLH